ncbi:exo-alpha-sialidase [Paenibacillus sp. NPDC056579]|uniref:sialidase family protein n=1 Tax=Paenibacillus sp. NPDC056579 TaxID=3345871 RepID=UPI00368033D9
MERFNGLLSVSAKDPQLEEALLPILYEPDSHCANLLELDNGDLLCVWFSGSGEGNPDTNIVVSRLPEGSKQWSTPVDLSADSEHSEQNPVLFQAPDKKVWLLHTSNEPHDQKSAKVILRQSEDRGHTWSEPVVLFDGPGLFLRQPIVVLSNGDWLLPAYYCKTGGHYSVVLISSDEGRSWQEFEVSGSLHRVQMSVVERKDGSLFAVFRSRHADRIYTSISEDHGRSWSAPEKTILPNNNSSIQLCKLNNGHLALVFNDSTMERDQFRWIERNGEFRKKALRTPLTVAVSEDGGNTWPYFKNVQTADEEHRVHPIGYSYPSIMAARDGSIHIAYSYLRKAIKYVRLTEEWVKQDGRGE